MAKSPTTPVKPDVWKHFIGSEQFMNAGIDLIGDYFSGQVSKYQAISQAEAKKTQYWTELAHTNRKNYRDYEWQLKSWYRAEDYTQKMRQYESDREKQQAVYKADVTDLATENFAKKIADLDGQFYEEEAVDDLELEEIRLKTVVDSAKKVAGGQVGRTINVMRDQYKQQYLSNLSNRQITREWRLADKVRAAESLDVARQNTINQVQFYTPQPVADPVKPMAPMKVEGYEPPSASTGSSSLFAINAVGKLANAALDYKDSLKPKSS